jgi:hypothetical protein
MSAQGFSAQLNYETMVTAYFSALNAQLQAGNETFALPDNIPPSMINTLTQLFSNQVNKDVNVEHDKQKQVFVLKPLGNIEKKDKVPRPANAFILYRKHQHDGVKKKYPGIANNDICEFPLFFQTENFMAYKMLSSKGSRTMER